jgi:uncharacterized NAD(P)/FAD-binding protein YdhS
MSVPSLSVAICGGGACGVAVLVHLLRENREAKRISHVYLYETRPIFGPGLAYSETSATATLNMAAETMGIYDGDALHFSRWIASHYPQLQGIRYPPRYIYGSYLCWLLEDARGDAVSQGVHQEVIHREVTSISHTTGKFRLLDVSGQTLAVDRVVLAIGNFTACTQPHLRNHPNYISNPWPLHRLGNLPSTSTVCIVGTRLSSIDAALYLINKRHTGPIYLVSREGRLPSVQARQPARPYRKRYALYVLAREFEVLCRPLSLQGMCGKFTPLLEQLGVQDWQAFLQKRDPLEQLSDNIRAADQVTAHWRPFADSAAPIFERYWRCLEMKGRVTFMEQWNSVWYAFVHAMPYDSALQVQKALREEKLEVLGFTTIRKMKTGFDIAAAKRLLHADYVVEATGLETDISQIHSSLLDSLVMAGLVDQCCLGGLTVDQETLESTAFKGLYAIGSLTTGVHFYTNGIDRNVAHASRIARHLVGKQARPPTHLALIIPSNSIFWANFITLVVPAMVEISLIPFLYLTPGPDTMKLGPREEFIVEVSHVGESPTSVIRKVAEEHGILACSLQCLDESAFGVLRQHHIDLGVQFAHGKPSERTEAVVQGQVISNDPLAVLFWGVDGALELDSTGRADPGKDEEDCEKQVSNIVLHALEVSRDHW